MWDFVCLLPEYPFSCFASYFCFLVIVVLLILVLFLVTVISLSLVFFFLCTIQVVLSIYQQSSMLLSPLLPFLDTYSLCHLLCIVISFLVEILPLSTYDLHHYECYVALLFISQVIMMDRSNGILAILRHYFKLSFKIIEVNCKNWEVKKIV